MKANSSLTRIFLSTVFLWTLSQSIGHLHAQDNTRQIPDALKPWEDWAIWGDQDRKAPTPYQDASTHLPSWPSTLNLSVDHATGKFDLALTVFAEAWIALPGNKEVWPLSVTSNGAPIPVLPHDDKPSVHLFPGTYHLSGTYKWDELPQRIIIPEEIGVLTLQVDGKTIDSATWDAEGYLWLKRDKSEATDKNFLGIKVYRMIEDGIPMWLHTQVELVVAGKSREEDLKSILPEGWQLAKVDSPIPVAVDESGHMKAQVRAGKWIIHLEAFHLTPAPVIGYAKGATPLLDEELVAFKAAPDFRMVTVEDVPSIDVSQTTFPQEWRNLPVYRWETATPFHLVERMRGMGMQKPEGLTIARQLWLDENGQRLVFLDQINGRRQQTWRLDVVPNVDLGSVRSAGQGQLITRDPRDGASGVEIRSRDINLQAAGRMQRASHLSATGWQTDADSLRVILNLPPGWRLFALFGADWVRGAWLTAWSLLDLFLLLIFTLAVYRMMGIPAGILAFISFGLAYHEPGAPRYLWLVLLIPIALLKVAPVGWPRWLVQVFKWIMVALLVINLAPFIVNQIQQALYPQLEGPEAPIASVFMLPPTGEIPPTVTTTNGMAADSATVTYSGGNTLNGGNTLSLGGTVSRGSAIVNNSDADAYNNAQVYNRNGFASGNHTQALSTPNSPVPATVNGPVEMEAAAPGGLPQAQGAEAKTDEDSIQQGKSWGRSSKSNLNYDVKTRIQTGPGVPQWRWRVVSFGWNGPVQASQTFHPILIPLWLERLLSVLRAVLLIVLAWKLLDGSKLYFVFSPKGRTVALSLALLALALGMTTPVRAQSTIPDKETLSTLRERLNETLDAYPNAADISTVTLTLRDRKITMDAEIDTALQVAVPLPGRLPAWSPISVRVDGQAQAALRRDGGYLWIALPAGVHHVHLEGLLPEVTEWEWTFQLKPRHVIIDAPGWTYNGVRPDGIPEQQVFFSQKQKASGIASSYGYDRQELHTIAAVDRHLEFGLVWQVHNEVTRLSSADRAVSIRVPLLPGEKVLTANITPVDGCIDVRLGANESSFTWDSELPVTDHLALATKPDDTWVERWYLIASPVWDVSITGLAPVFEPDAADLVPVWHPWPGEKVDLGITRPEPIGGATVTVHNVRHDVSLGDRQRTSTLVLQLQCSLGEDFGIELPMDASITSLSQSGALLPVRKDGTRVIVPLQPGEQAIEIHWKTATSMGFKSSVDAVHLPVDSANITTVLHVPSSRWVLWTYGPLRGPAVQFWVILICSLLAAQIVSRLKLSPLTAGQWTLLALGLAQVQLGGLIVVAWLFLLAWRGTDSFQQQKSWLYNLLQLVLVGMTLLVFALLLDVLKAGFLGHPDMSILGNGSTSTMLQWYQAETGTSLPQPGCLSVSIWWYRLLMLAWALWLASSLIRWLTWGWMQFSKGGLARRLWEKKNTPPPMPPLPTTTP